MDASSRTSSITQTSQNNTSLMLFMAFLGSIANHLGMALIALSIGINILRFSSTDERTVPLFVLGIFFLFGGFFAITIYPANKQNKLFISFLLFVTFTVTAASSFYLVGWIIYKLFARNIDVLNYVDISIGAGIIVSLAIFLFMTARIKSRAEYAGLGQGVAIGIILSFLSTLNPEYPYILSFGSSPVWLSIVFFPELLSRRAGWRDTLLWAGMVLVSVYINFQVFKLLFG
ncbi:MAG: hypothetical protein L6461_09665 [Anaerolineae bacterium]|nr:hypothetical protein [Anaerolineae bacterium]